MKRNFLTLAVSLLVSPAFAQQVPTPNPCQHGSTQMSIAGMDMDTMRCENALLKTNIVDLILQSINSNTALKMMEGDAAAAAARAEATRKAEVDKKAEAAKKTDEDKADTTKDGSSTSK